MTERIIIELDDSQLDASLAKIIVVGGEGEKITGTRNLAKGLPTINRELRLILSQVPGLREAISYWFRIRRLARGVDIGGVQLYLTLLATFIILFKQVQAYQDRLDRRQREYERRIRQARGWTHEEFLKGVESWEEYARGMPP